MEGPTDDESIGQIRATRQRSMLVTLLLSQGVRMILAGDELGRSQQGNNNAYCQDNEISWINWEHTHGELLYFVSRVSSLRSSHAVFRRRRWFEGRELHGDEVDEIRWYAPEGTEMTLDDWNVGYARSLSVYLNGDVATDGLAGDSFLLLFNAGRDSKEFLIP